MFKIYKTGSEDILVLLHILQMAYLKFMLLLLQQTLIIFGVYFIHIWHFMFWLCFYHEGDCQVFLIFNVTCNRWDENIVLGWLQYHVWNKKPTRCHLVLNFFLSISPYKLLNMFRAILCPSSAADDLVVFFRFVAEL